MSDPDIPAHHVRARAIDQDLGTLNQLAAEQKIEKLQDESLDVLIVLQARLESGSRRHLAPSIQGLIDRRLHVEQMSASVMLRDSMEKVEKTLAEVERRQRRIEGVGLFVGFVGLALAAVQIWVATRAIQ